MRFFFKHPTLDQAFLRALSPTYLGYADIGESFFTASKVDESNLHSWHEQWKLLAENKYSSAELAEEKGHIHTAYERYLQAAHYYQTCARFLIGDNEQEKQLFLTYQKFTKSSKKAFKISQTPVEEGTYIYEDCTICYTLFFADTICRPLLVYFGDYNQWHQEAAIHFTKKAHEGGFHVLAVDLPGQGDTIIKAQKTIRPDSSIIFSELYDKLSSHPLFSGQPFYFYGRGFGSIIASQCAVMLPANGLIVDPGYFHPKQQLLMVSDAKTEIEPNLEQTISLVMQDKLIASRFKTMMWVHGASTPQELLQSWEEFSLENAVEEIGCHTLVFEPPSFDDLFYKKLSCPKKKIAFSPQNGVFHQCSLGAYGLYLASALDWLCEIAPQTAFGEQLLEKELLSKENDGDEKTASAYSFRSSFIEQNLPPSPINERHIAYCPISNEDL